MTVTQEKMDQPQDAVLPTYEALRDKLLELLNQVAKKIHEGLSNEDLELRDFYGATPSITSLHRELISAMKLQLAMDKQAHELAGDDDLPALELAVVMARLDEMMGVAL